MIELVIAYRRASQAGLINPMEPFVDAQSNENVKAFSNGWCVKTGSSGEELRQYVRAHCERRGGALENDWCTTAGGDVPIYKARIEATKACSGDAWMKEWSWINAAIVEPADGKRAGFVEAAKRIGFRPASDVAGERQREQQKADSEARIARARQEQQAPARRQIGAMICKVRNSVRYIGYVEARSPDSDKVQIRIADAESVNSRGLRPGGFEPTVIWDSPDAWELCGG